MSKELFYNSKGFNTAEVNLITSKGKDVKLHYHLHDNPVQHIWQELFRKNLNIGKQWSSESSIEELRQELQKYCEPEDVILPENINQEYLNELHNQFVSSNRNSNWIKINEYIHKIESKLVLFSEYDSSFNFSSQNTESVLIKDEYKLFLCSDSVWGRLNLGYATLGKDWQTISSNNDDIKDLHTQEYITTEAYASFSAEDPFDKIREQQFYKWALTKDLDIPLNNLTTLSFGRYILGTIIITDTFLNYHSYASDWYVPNHSCKLNWNRDVIGGTLIVNDVKFYDSDLYFDTFKKHTGLTNV